MATPAESKCCFNFLYAAEEKSSLIASFRYDLESTEAYRNHYTISVKSWTRSNARCFRSVIKMEFGAVFKTESHGDLTYKIVKKIDSS